MKPEARHYEQAIDLLTAYYAANRIVVDTCKEIKIRAAELASTDTSDNNAENGNG